MRREVGSFERAQAITGENAPYNAVAVLRLRPGPETEPTRLALDRLLSRRPLLGARIVRESNRHFIELPNEPTPIPLRVVERPNDETWRWVTERELQERLPADEGPLARALLVGDGSSGEARELILTVHHAVIDASSGLATVRELVEGLDGPWPGEADGPVGPALPPSADSGFPGIYRGGLHRSARLTAFAARQAADEVAYRLRIRGRRMAPIRYDGHCRILPTSLSTAATEALIRRCREERVTLNSAVCAAQLQAALFHFFAGRGRPMRYMVFPDLRPYLDPPVAAGSPGCHIAAVRHTLDIDPREDLWSLSRRIQAQIHRSSARGEKFLSSLFSPTTIRLLFRQGSARMSDVAASYIGPTGLPSRIGRFEIEALHSFVSNFGLGPEFTAQIRLHRGRLWWDIVYLDSDMDSAAAAGATGDMLRRLGHMGD